MAIDFGNITDESVQILKNHGFTKSRSLKVKAIDEYWHWVHEKCFRQYQTKAINGKPNHGINYSSVPSMEEIQSNREGAISELELFFNLSRRSNDHTAQLALKNMKRAFNMNNIDDQIFHTQLFSIISPRTSSPTIKIIQQYLREPRIIVIQWQSNDIENAAPKAAHDA